MDGCEGLGWQEHRAVNDDFIHPHNTGGVIVENKEVISLQLNQQNLIGHLVGTQPEDLSLSEILPARKLSSLTSILNSRVQGVDFYGDEINVFGVFRNETDGHTLNGDNRLCVTIEAIGEKISVKSFVSKLEVLDASINDLYGAVDSMNRLKGTKFCQGS